MNPKILQALYAANIAYCGYKITQSQGFWENLGCAISIGFAYDAFNNARTANPTYKATRSAYKKRASVAQFYKK